MNIWQRKLLAFLHDPPEKAYDYSPAHQERADTHAKAFGLVPELWPSKNPDWAASAADRFIFPSGTKRKASLGEAVGFRHPFSGARSGSFPERKVAEEAVSDINPAFADLPDQDRFWLAWRLWREYAATYARSPDAGWLCYLPADTRIADGTIWHHCAVTSALEATRDGNTKDSPLRPAFLLFQVGPVQEFIEQARTTRDLWSGSYLLSWLTMHALNVIAERFGPDCIVFPSLWGQPLYDWLNRERLKKACYRSGGDTSKSAWEAKNGPAFQQSVLTPTVPNRFLAIVPEGFDPGECERALKEEWQRIADACREWLREHRCDLPEKGGRLWGFEIEHQWQTTWQMWLWRNVPETHDRLARLPGSLAGRLRKAYDVAKSIPDSERDDRCWPGGEPNPGWAWAGHYALVSYYHAARRQTRDFAAWLNPRETERVPKDPFSGREEVVVDDAWLARVREHPELRHLFRGGELLGAANLVKRIWHTAYLEEKRGLHRARQSFDSVPAVAAAPWLDRVKTALKQSPDSLQSFLDAAGKISRVAPALEDVHVAEAEAKESEWLDRTDAMVFHRSFWQNLDRLVREKEEVKEAAAALKNFKKQAGLGEPGCYYAVLALDGDQMGKWLAGEMAPQVRDVLAPKAVTYFKELNGGAEWLKEPRPVSPSYHLQFSEALANFSLYAARRIVEAHHGQLIYAGGDDVLAMLPAEEAIACADDLRRAFQGDSSQSVFSSSPSVFEVPAEGFIRLPAKGRSPAEPSWPLLVPGPRATVSAGIAIGHCHSPLQNLVEAARKAEHRAKTEYGRQAFAVRLFKRSGEIVEWGAKWDSAAIPLLKTFADLSQNERLTGRFTYALAELLRPYASADWRIEKTENFDPFEVFPKELEHVARRQGRWLNDNGGKTEADQFLKLAKEYLGVDAKDPERTCRGRKLNDFLGPFLTHAFLSRKGEE